LLHERKALDFLSFSLVSVKPLPPKRSRWNKRRTAVSVLSLGLLNPFGTKADKRKREAETN
jgi:hypothetical protein